jgi:hypothetical protein
LSVCPSGSFWLGLEAGYRDWGHVEIQVDAIVSDSDALSEVIKNNYPVSGAGPYLGTRLSHRPNKEQELYFKIGAWSWSGDYHLTVDGQDEMFNKSDVDILLGAGFNLFVIENLGAGLMIERVSLLGQGQTTVGMGVVWRF